MATFDEQILIAWDEWEQKTGAEANNPDDFVSWAMENKKLLPQLQDIRGLLRKRVTRALEGQYATIRLASPIEPSSVLLSAKRVCSFLCGSIPTKVAPQIYVRRRSVNDAKQLPLTYIAPCAMLST